MMHYNKYQPGAKHFEFPESVKYILKGILKQPGIYHLNIKMDQNVGNEVILAIYDPTDFIYELKAVKPFRFFSSQLAVSTTFGPIFSFLFWVAQPFDVGSPFVIYDKPLNVSNSHEIQPWVSLSNQSHLHLVLINEKFELIDLFEFENDFGFNQYLGNNSNIFEANFDDFDMALNEYFEKYTLKNLFAMTKHDK